ncbi:MAG: NADH-quinone oxidoreductase subunit J [Acidobacteria bacterium]|nr:MAG: NADH-quinone oxidoreductase subunit J [Acidobacteriota bacterium]
MDANFVQQAIWYFFAALTVLSAAVVVFSRSLIHSAFSLLFTFFGVAALYVMLGADFLAATQLVIYVGGILVLLLFGVMLTHKLYNLDLRTETFQFFPGLLVTSAVFLTLGGVMLRTEWHRGPERAPAPTTAQIGELFMRDYILPFEIASVFLLVALIGAAMIVRRREPQ